MKVVLLDFTRGRSGVKVGAAIAAITVIIALLVTIIYRENIYGKYEAVSGVGETGRVIVIDAGHGGEDPGAIGTNGSYEKDINLSIAKQIGLLLSEKGYTVVYTRTEDRLLYGENENIKGMKKYYDLKNRCEIANDYPDSIFISIHMNSFAAERYSGLQVYYKVGCDESKMLASSIQSGVIADVQPENNRTIKEGNSFYVLNNCLGSAILIECGFMTNKAECEKLSEKEYQKELSFSIVCGIINYIEDCT